MTTKKKPGSSPEYIKSGPQEVLALLGFYNAKSFLPMPVSTVPETKPTSPDFPDEMD